MSERAHQTATLVATGCLLAGGLVAATALAAEAAAVPTPPKTGCPASFELTAVSDLVAGGYIGIDQFDLNNDSNICTKPVNPVVQEKICAERPGGVCTVPIIYYLTDNWLTPAFP